MEGERQETYERIPWETLQAPKTDRQWIIYLLAGAIVVGALAYSFMSNRSVGSTIQAVPVESQPAITAQAAATSPASADPIPDTGTGAASVASPVVVSEADLFAVDPEVRRDQAAAHAEWFAAEYFTVDGSSQDGSSLTSLMPVGIPMPQGDETTRVFVESATAVNTETLDGLTYRVEVMVRWLKSSGDDVYVRQPPILASLDIEVGETGPSVVLPPAISPLATTPQSTPELVEVPEEIGLLAMEKSSATELIGGLGSVDGTWRVVVMAPGPDGLIRPQTVTVP